MSLDLISPIDGRYTSKTDELQAFFSEHALIKYRLFVELKYLIQLSTLNIKGFKSFNDDQIAKIESIFTQFSSNASQRVKEIEKVTNHDVKAVEYFIKENLENSGMQDWCEWIHFALTSQDINNTAFPLMIRDALNSIIYPWLNHLITELKERADVWKGVAMLSRTHGQPASPTLVGKELLVFVERLEDQIMLLKSLPIKAKFGGATGNFNAHLIAYPNIDWGAFADDFVEKELGLVRSKYTTQIAHYDHLAAIFHNLSRINTILIDFCRDIWTYISLEYFKQKLKEGQVGSSTMPHKVNPIDFENAEGNLGLANSQFIHLASKLPISRLQRDLTDSTVLRNVGVPFAHTLIALKSILNGISKLKLNKEALKQDLDNHWAVVTEAIQTILRREGVPGAYELLKEFAHANPKVNQENILQFIDGLDISSELKDELRRINPHNYTGIW